MSIFSNTETTGQGHKLLSKVLAGQCKLKFTHAAAGDGHFDAATHESSDSNALELTELINHRLDGRIVGVREMGLFTEIDCLVTNQHLTEFMEFREIGIWAVGEVDGEPIGESILYSYAHASEHPSPIGAFNGVWLHEEFITIRVYTANATNIKAEIVQSALASEVTFDNSQSELAGSSVQDAMDEIARRLTDIAARPTLGAIPIKTIPGYIPHFAAQSQSQSPIS